MMSLPTRGSTPPTEVPERARRRTFTAEYKRRILLEADGCKGTGDISALLRREGLYSSHLTEWRKLTKLEGPEDYTTYPNWYDFGDPTALIADASDQPSKGLFLALVDTIRWADQRSF